MKSLKTFTAGILVFCLSIADGRAEELAGLWQAKKSFVPKHHGTLTVARQEDAWTAEVAGTRVKGVADGDRVRFELPGGEDVFLGGGETLVLRLDEAGDISRSQWIQKFTVRNGQATNTAVALRKRGPDRWQGEVVPMEDGFTLYLVLSQRQDGTLGAFLRNPDRNLGVFLNLKRVEREGNRLRFVGTFMQREEEQVFFEGRYDPDWDKFVVDIPNRGGAYDFYRVGDSASDFYARGERNPPAYSYTPPPDTGDGWAVGTLDEANIDFGPIRAMVENEIDPPADSVDDLYVHGLLIARNGKLVFEDYFHGYHRELPHDTRSASKSLTSVLTGAVIEGGYPVSTSMPIYETIYGDDLPADLDPRKQRITLDNLLTMTSGFYCDDSDSNAPGNEDVMQEQQDNLDWYDYTLVLPMALDPGEEAIYCSANPNLIGKVLSETTGQPLEDLFQDLVAGPLQLGRYHLNLQPTGEPYMGGGIYWMPRDFMKLGQLMLNGGRWNGRRVVSEAWVEQSTKLHYPLRERGYGYLWWVVDYPYADRTVKAFFAGGNGGQTVIGIPELDLVIAFWGGNYSSRTLYRMSGDLVTDYILPAVRDEQDASSTTDGARLALPQEAVELDDAIPRLMAEAGIPGLSIALVRGGEVAWTGAYGVMSAESDVPVTDRTVFEAASLSKPVFALVALDALERGLIDLDVPISTYYRYERFAADERVDLITPAMVLSHRTGLPNWDREGDLELERDPGERFGYSGEGYVYLQKALEARTGRGLEEQAEDVVFKPFGMTDTGFLWRDDYQTRLAMGHDAAGLGQERNRYVEENAAYSLVTTASDYGAFLANVMRGANLNEALLKDMLSTHTRMIGTETKTVHPPEIWGVIHWGLGWGIQAIDGKRIYFHWGDNDFYHAFVAFSPADDIGFVYFTNSQNGLGIAGDVASIVVDDMTPAIEWLGY